MAKQTRPNRAVATHTMTTRKAISPTELAAQLGISPASALRACRDGRVRSVQLGKRLLIPTDEVDRILSMGNYEISKKTSLDDALMLIAQHLGELVTIYRQTFEFTLQQTQRYNDHDDEHIAWDREDRDYYRQERARRKKDDQEHARLRRAHLRTAELEAQGAVHPARSTHPTRPARARAANAT